MVVAQPEDRSAGNVSTYLQYLPACYSQREFLGRPNDFLGRFLKIFQSILDPLEGVVDNLAYYFDPDTTPEELLPWLASWVDLVLDESWPIDRRRSLVKGAVELFQWRGTRRGLKEHLRLYAGVEPQITEDFGGIPLGGGARLGWTTVLGGGRQHTFDVTLELEDPQSVDAEHLKAIIEAQKPAHAGYTLQLVFKEVRDEGGAPGASGSDVQNGQQETDLTGD